ncbi:homeobox protein goosecoid-like [Adelges cooleyi]|uniref:homeobox protein goosecoid-like n=1 Tax=Adelges cooleyi TaxID=133065 RepID=UPI0021806409|nr:homeobox protein goosecoid-like [Adelges cooleyi]
MCSQQSLYANQKRRRTVFSQHQIFEMEKLFQSTRYPTILQRENLAKQVNLHQSTIQVWFQNKRAKLRKESKLQNSQNTLQYHHLETIASPSSTGPDEQYINNNFYDHGLNLRPNLGMVEEYDLVETISRLFN